MAQFAFVTAYGPDNPSSSTTIPINLTVRYVDTDTNALDQFSVQFTVATGSTANQIMAAAVTAVKATGASHGYGSLGTNSVIGPQIVIGG